MHNTMIIFGLFLSILMTGCNDKASDTKKSDFVLTAWNDLGMHCINGDDFSVFAILPPSNSIHAQLKDKNGELVTSGVTLTYEAIPDKDGKINTSSIDKTNFWDYATVLYHKSPEPDVGLKESRMASKNPAPLEFDTKNQFWEAEGIPKTQYNDDGTTNYYSLVKVVAKDKAGKVLATAKTVLPVSNEMDCRRCHASTAGDAARPQAGWANNPNAEKDYKFNILRIHDEKEPTAVSNNMAALQAAGYNYNAQGLEATVNGGTAVLCAACHKSNALPGLGIGLTPSLSSVLHTKHAGVVDPNNGMKLGDSRNRTACYACHPGEETKCLRGAMGDAKINGTNSIQCQNCHGTVGAVGNKNRKDWLAEPNCQACHHDGVRETSAIDPLTNTLRHSLDTKFATNPDTPAKGLSLFRFSTGHGNLQCEACHGAPHAIYPAHEADNILSKSIQGHKGTIAECKSCHTTVPRTVNKGPHGIHSVGQSWIKDHQNAAQTNATQCKACHGQDYKGTPLSKTWTKRTFSVKGEDKNFAKGHKVSCYDCHNGPTGRL